MIRYRVYDVIDKTDRNNKFINKKKRVGILFKCIYIEIKYVRYPNIYCITLEYNVQ